MKTKRSVLIKEAENRQMDVLEYIHQLIREDKEFEIDNDIRSI